MVRNLVIPIVVSIACGLIGVISGERFVVWFGLSFIMQLILFFIINTAVKAYIQIQVNRLEVERLNAMDQNKVQLPCAVCKEVNDTLIYIGDVNEFRCIRCNALNSISVNISNFQKTEIVAETGLITESLLAKMNISTPAVEDSSVTPLTSS